MPQSFVLLMRRDLDGPIAPPVWPAGVSVQTLGAKPDQKLLKAAHAVLEPGYWEGGGGAPIFRQWWKALHKDKEYDPALVLIATDGEGVAGLAQCWTSAFVKDLAVAPRMRRKGLGRALMLHAFSEFARRGAAHVDLKVREDNEGAVALYHSLRMRTIERLRVDS
jgi:ribosomal protein S18 acetylase RimI-like enzyme